jgi:HEAT repeat protein
VNRDGPAGDYTPAGEHESWHSESVAFGLHLDADPTLRRPTAPAPDAPDPEPERARIEEELGIVALASSLAEYGTPPAAPPAGHADRDALEAELLRTAMADVPPWNVSARRTLRHDVREQASHQAQAEDERLATEQRQLQQELDARWAELKALRDRAANDVEQWVNEEVRRREVARVEQQAALDSEWQRLIDADSDSVTETLRAAFPDGTTTVLGSLDGIAVVIVACPGMDDVIGEEEPAFTSAGRRTVHARSEARRNDLYLSAIASRVLAAVGRALSTTAVRAVTCVAVGACESSDHPWEPIYVGTFQRAYAERLLAEGRWSPDPDALAEALEDAEEVDLELTGRTQEIAALDLSDDPGLAAVIDQMDPAIRSDEDAARTSDQQAVKTFLNYPDAEHDTHDDKRGDEPADLRYDADTAAHEPPSGPASTPHESTQGGTPDGSESSQDDAVSERAGEPLPEALEDSDDSVRRAAVEAIDTRNDSSDTPLLLEALKSDQEAVKTVLNYADGEHDTHDDKRGDEPADLRHDTDTAAHEPPGGPASTPHEPTQERTHGGSELSQDAIASGRGGDPLPAALEDIDDSVRRAAVEAIGRRNDPSDLPLLLEALADRDDFVRLEAIYAVKDRLTLEMRRDALTKAYGDVDENVRRKAVEALAVLDDERDTSLLVRALEDSDSGVRLEAIRAVRDRLAPDLRDALIKACGDIDENVRRKAFQALAELDDERDTPLLLKALNDRDDHARLEAIYAVKDRLTPDMRRDVLIKACGDVDENVRRKAFEGLAVLGDERDTPLLLEALEDADCGVRLEAMYAVRGRLVPDMRDALIKACGDVDENVRRKAFEALAELDDERDTPLLLKASNDRDANVRLEASYAVKNRLTPDMRRDALLKACGDVDENVRRKAFRALAELGDERDTPLLLEALEDADCGVRLEAIYAVRDRLTPDMHDALIKACGDVDENVRRKAFEALAELDDESDTPLLLKALKDSDSGVRLETLYALEGRSTLGSSSRLSAPLSNAMKDEDASVRQAAVRLFGRLEQAIDAEEAPAAP